MKASGTATGNRTSSKPRGSRPKPRRSRSRARATGDRFPVRVSTRCGRTCPKLFVRRATGFMAGNTSARPWISGASLRSWLWTAGGVTTELPPLVSIPMPLILDLSSPAHTLPQLDAVIEQTAAATDLIAILDARHQPATEKHLRHIAFYLGPDSPPVPAEVLRKTRLVEIADSPAVIERIKAIKKIHPQIVAAIRVELTADGPRARHRAGRVAGGRGDPCRGGRQRQRNRRGNRRAL